MLGGANGTRGACLSRGGPNMGSEISHVVHSPLNITPPITAKGASALGEVDFLIREGVMEGVLARDASLFGCRSALGGQISRITKH